MKKMDGVLIKMDEKAYDQVNSSFLQQTLRMKGFHLCGVNGSQYLCKVATLGFMLVML
jgi:hypothetical protein